MQAAETLTEIMSQAEERRRMLLRDLLENAERGQDTGETLKALKQEEDEIARLRKQQGH